MATHTLGDLSQNSLLNRLAEYDPTSPPNSKDVKKGVTAHLQILNLLERPILICVSVKEALKEILNRNPLVALAVESGMPMKQQHMMDMAWISACEEAWLVDWPKREPPSDEASVIRLSVDEERYRDPPFRPLVDEYSSARVNVKRQAHEFVEEKMGGKNWNWNFANANRLASAAQSGFIQALKATIWPKPEQPGYFYEVFSPMLHAFESGLCLFWIFREQVICVLQQERSG